MAAALARRCAEPIRRVIVYRGHEKHPKFGPYPESINKRIAMLEQINELRQNRKQLPWQIDTVPGEWLSHALRTSRMQQTLLVIPAGESTRLDTVFSQQEADCIKHEFLEKGGRAYLTCGAAYWASQKRIYRDVCEVMPNNQATIEKTSKLSLFQGIAHGPLCPYPGKKYKTGFYSDAIAIEGGGQQCTVFLGGGGAFIPDKKADQKIAILAQYLPSELERIGKPKQEHSQWNTATIAATVGKGAAILSMFHPYYGAKDIDVEAYEQTFPESGSNWAEIKQKLSPLTTRLAFAEKMLHALEICVK